MNLEGFAHLSIPYEINAQCMYIVQIVFDMISDTCFLHDRLHRDGDELSEELAQAEPDVGDAEVRGPGHPRHLAHAAHHCNTALVSTCSSDMCPFLLCATICMLVSHNCCKHVSKGTK